MARKIWTIGHSTHTLDGFLEILTAHEIQVVADIRRFPGSRRLPHFNSENLSAALANAGIDYHHIVELGGRRNPRPDSKNSAWRVAAFRGYADFMDTDEFKSGVGKLKMLAENKRLAYMCSEAVWWSCHRALVSDYLKHDGWTVLHILSKVKAEEHPWTKPARVVDGELVYSVQGSLNL